MRRHRVTMLGITLLFILLASFHEKVQGFCTSPFASVVARCHRLDEHSKSQTNVLSMSQNCFDHEVSAVDQYLPIDSTVRRRGFLKGLMTGYWSISAFSKPTFADEIEPSSSNQKVFVKGTVNLPAKLELPPDTSSSALYVTVRPNNPVNVPKAILDGSNGKPPPILSIKITNINAFPCEFKLTDNDLTLEGNAKIRQDNGEEKFWWEGQDLIVSSRWDTDGVAATRDPTDLVGRSYYLASTGDDVVKIGRAHV